MVLPLVSVDRGSKATLPLKIRRRVFKSSAKGSTRWSIGIALQGVSLNGTTTGTTHGTTTGTATGTTNGTTNDTTTDTTTSTTNGSVRTNGRK